MANSLGMSGWGMNSGTGGTAKRFLSHPPSVQLSCLLFTEPTTPRRKLHTWGNSISPLCPRCTSANGSHSHAMAMPQTSPPLGKGVYNFELPMFDKGNNRSQICTLVPEDLLPEEMHNMWTRSFYLAGKLITKVDFAYTPNKQWCEVLNFTLRREKWTYKHRGCPHKISKNTVLVGGL